MYFFLFLECFLNRKPNIVFLCIIVFYVSYRNAPHKNKSLRFVRSTIDRILLNISNTELAKRFSNNLLELTNTDYFSVAVWYILVIASNWLKRGELLNSKITRWNIQEQIKDDFPKALTSQRYFPKWQLPKCAVFTKLS